jgi:hypothetical protein
MGGVLVAMHRGLLLAGVVEMVSLAVPVRAPAMVTGEVEPKLAVGKSDAPDGPPLITALRTTLPLNPLAGVMAMVEVFPVVAPGETVIPVPLTVKLASRASVTVIEAVPAVGL